MDKSIVATYNMAIAKIDYTYIPLVDDWMVVSSTIHIKTTTDCRFIMVSKTAQSDDNNTSSIAHSNQPL